MAKIIPNERERQRGGDGVTDTRDPNRSEGGSGGVGGKEKGRRALPRQAAVWRQEFASHRPLRSVVPPFLPRLPDTGTVLHFSTASFFLARPLAHLSSSLARSLTFLPPHNPRPYQLGTIAPSSAGRLFGCCSEQARPHERADGPSDLSEPGRRRAGTGLRASKPGPPRSERALARPGPAPGCKPVEAKTTQRLPAATRPSF